MRISEKTLIKWKDEDIELHKRVITTYLHQIGAKSKTIKRLFKLYDLCINHRNIHCYFHLPVKLLVRALVLDQLDAVCQYRYPDGRESLKVKKNVQRKR